MGTSVKRWLTGNGWPLGLAAGALALRLAYLATLAHADPLFRSLVVCPDGFFFNHWALDIVARRDWLGGPDCFFIGPLYGYFLAALYATVNPSFTAVKVIQAVLDAGTALFIYGFTRRTFGPTPARVAGALWALYLPAVFFAAYLLPVTLGLFLVAAAFYFLALGAEGKPAWFAGAGLALGLFALDRPNVLLFALATIPVFVVFRRRLGWLKPALFVAAFAALPAAVTLRNYAVAGDWVVVSSQGGINFYIGNAPEADGTYWSPGSTAEGSPEALNRDYAARTAAPALGKGAGAGAVSRWWLGRGLDWLAAHPGAAARLYSRKLRLLTNDVEVGLNEDFYFAGEFVPAHRAPWPWFGFLFAFGVIGAAVARPRLPTARWLGAAFLVAYAASVLAFFITARYRAPLTPLLAAFAGAGLTAWYDAWRRGRRRAAAALTLVALTLGSWAVYPVAGVPRNRLFGWYYGSYGNYFLDADDYARAAAYFERAVAATPGAEDGYYLLSVAYYEGGETEVAVRTLERGVAACPRSPKLLYSLGTALLARGRAAEAIGPLETATDLDAANPARWTALAQAYRAQGDLAAAAAAAERAARLDPRDANAWLLVMDVALLAGDEAKGRAAAAKAAAANAKLGSPAVILGRWYVGRGDDARADRYFAEAARGAG